jgi:DNA-binding transcriptional ArsR family regulator
VTSAKLLLHPVRLRIIEAFLGDRKLTTADLRAELPDVPPASLYRHLARLIDAGVLDVLSERKVRGTIERTYVKHSQLNISRTELAQLSREELRRVFLSHVAALLTDIDHYLERDDTNVRQGGATFRIAALWLTDDELRELAARFGKLLQPYLDLPATPDRTRRVVRTIVLPGDDAREASLPARQRNGGRGSANE